MDPNKRGNPPFEPSSYAAGLERRVKRAAEWHRDAMQNARWLFEGDAEQRVAAAAWWFAQLNQPVVVTSAETNLSRL